MVAASVVADTCGFGAPEEEHSQDGVDRRADRGAALVRRRGGGAVRAVTTETPAPIVEPAAPAPKPAKLPKPKKVKKIETPEEKQERIERERERLLVAIADRMTNDTRAKVGYVLNHFPAARDSDIALAHHVWKTFYSDHIEAGDRVRLKDMYRLPRQTTIARTRALIQNKGSSWK
jgi:hypothetical protein